MESSPNLLPLDVTDYPEIYELGDAHSPEYNANDDAPSSPVMFEITDEMADFLLVVDEKQETVVKEEDAVKREEQIIYPEAQAYSEEGLAVVKEEVIVQQSRVKLGITGAKLVGMKHHTQAILIANEPLYLHRDMANQFDMNEIAVKTGKQSIIGYISANVAVALAPMIDSGIEVEGVCEKVGGARAAINIILTFYGTFSMIPIFDSLMEASNLENALKDNDILDSANQNDTRKLFDEAMGYVDLSTLPLSPRPPSHLIKVCLMKHQLQALEWMRNRESLSFPSDPFDLSPVDFWSRSTKDGFVQALTGEKTKTLPLCRGGILADDMVNYSFEMQVYMSLLSISRCLSSLF